EQASNVPIICHVVLEDEKKHKRRIFSGLYIRLYQGLRPVGISLIPPLFFIQKIGFMAYYASMEVKLFYNSSRPVVGMKPGREGKRPLLPQHSRHCPVLEAGSALGFMVYPPLTEKESFHIEFQGDGRYQFIYYLGKSVSQDLEPLCSVTIILPVGSIG